jgi:hypothetical protein
MGSAAVSLHIIAVENVGQCYRLYARPQDRLLEALSPGRHSYHQDFESRQFRPACDGPRARRS